MNILKGNGAILAGFMVIVVLSGVIDTILKGAGLIQQIGRLSPLGCSWLQLRSEPWFRYSVESRSGDWLHESQSTTIRVWH